MRRFTSQFPICNMARIHRSAAKNMRKIFPSPLWLHTIGGLLLYRKLEIGRCVYASFSYTSLCGVHNQLLHTVLNCLGSFGRVLPREITSWRRLLSAADLHPGTLASLGVTYIQSSLCITVLHIEYPGCSRDWGLVETLYLGNNPQESLSCSSITLFHTQRK